MIWEGGCKQLAGCLQCTRYSLKGFDFTVVQSWEAGTCCMRTALPLLAPRPGTKF